MSRRLPVVARLGEDGRCETLRDGQPLVTLADHDDPDGLCAPDLLAASVGACMLSAMETLARRKGWDMSAAQVAVTLARHPKTLALEGMAIAISTGLPPDDRRSKALKRAAATCPVHKALDLPTSVAIDGA